MKREWAIPVILGLLAATAAWTMQPGPKDGGGPDGSPTATSSATGAPSDPTIILPFAEGTATDGGSLTFLVLAPKGKAAAMADVNGSAAAAWSRDLAWQEDGLAIHTAHVTTCDPSNELPPACDPPWNHGRWPLPRFSGVPASERPLLGVDGFNGTRITVHVFDETGLLAATNAPDNETAAFIGDAHPQRLPAGVWYVGANSTAPNGTQPIPATARALFQQLKPVMQGLPVSGVASVRSDAYAAVYGTLYVTVRIDGLVYAP